MSIITGNPANFPNSLSIPDDGVDIKAANVNPSEQAAADRTAALARRVLPTAATPFGGAALVPTDLTAITGMVDYETRHLPGYGLYMYRAAATNQTDGAWVVNGNAGVGRWLHTEYLQQIARLIAHEELSYEGARIDVIAAGKTVSDPGNRNHTVNFAVAILTSANLYTIHPGDLFEIGYTVPYLSSGGVVVDPVVGVGFSATGAGVLAYPDVLLDNSCQLTVDVDRGGRDQGLGFPAAQVSKYLFARSHVFVQEVIGNHKICLALGQVSGAAANYYVTQGASMSITQWRVSLS